VVPVEVGVPGTVLKLDPATAACIEATRAALRGAGFQAGRDILALYGLPGLVYAVGGVSPVRPWFFHQGHWGHEENLGALKLIPPERIKAAFLFLSGSDGWAESQLSEGGVALREEYSPIGRSVVPFRNQNVEILKPRSKEPAAPLPSP